MNVAELIYYLKEALYLIFWLSLPPLAVASVVGTLFSLFQALTQIQEQTLSFAIKLLAVFSDAAADGWLDRRGNFQLLAIDLRIVPCDPDNEREPHEGYRHRTLLSMSCCCPSC